MRKYKFIRGAKMKSILKLSILFLLLFVISCSEDDNPVDTPDPVPEVAYEKLSITTDSQIYTWYQDGEVTYITIKGTVANESETIFYSSLGEFMLLGEQNQLLIAKNSHGYYEKYNESNETWEETDLGGMLIEGTKFVPVKPTENYSLLGTIFEGDSEFESGTHRIRIDYYDTDSPDSGATPYFDYSNSFNLQ